MSQKKNTWSKVSDKDQTDDSTGALLLGLSAPIIWHQTISITAPWQSALVAADRIAHWDLGSAIAVSGHDEAALLQGGLLQMRNDLARRVTTVRDGAEKIAVGAREIAKGDADLSKRTETQAAKLEEIAASMEEIDGTVKNADAIAVKANPVASLARVVAVKGDEVVREVAATMEQITLSSRKIADIIGVIDGIAFQSNTMALDAAVEAARAGEEASRGAALQW